MGWAAIRQTAWLLHLHLLSGHGSPARPRFSWDTLPVFYHSCNLSGAFTSEAIKVVAKFPLVTIEKGQGVFDPDDKRFAEDKILDTLRRVKTADPNVSAIFYYNSLLDWPFYRLHEQFLQHPEWWVKKQDGSVCRMSGDGQFPNSTGILAFDFAQADVRDFWVDECVNMTRSGVVDGCFVDRAIDTPCGAGDAYRKGHVMVQQQLQIALGDGLVIANHAYDMPGVSATMIEFFGSNEESIQTLMAAAAQGKVVLAHGGCGEGVIAAFLIGAGQGSYFGCSHGWSVQSDPIGEAWRPEFDRPLGFPRGSAVKEGDVYRRAFEHPSGRTLVSFNVTSKLGLILWADQAPQWPLQV